MNCATSSPREVGRFAIRKTGRRSRGAASPDDAVDDVVVKIHRLVADENVAPTDPVVLGCIALVLTYSAYVAEVYRAGIESVHPSQRAAASGKRRRESSIV